MTQPGVLFLQTLVPYDVWAYTERSTIVIGSNTNRIPDIPLWNPKILLSTKPCIDGCWGTAEYSRIPQYYDNRFPYLAWMPTNNFDRLEIPTTVNTFRLDENPSQPNSVFVRHPGWQHRGYLHTDIQEALQKDVIYYIGMVHNIIAMNTTAATHPEICPPAIALVWAHNSAFCLRLPHLTYRDLLEYLGGLRRSIAELQSYVLWYDCFELGGVRPMDRSFNHGLRGSVARTVDEYMTLRKWGAPVWLEINLESGLTLDSRKEVQLTGLDLETSTWDDLRGSVSSFLLDSTKKGVLVHNKPLEYYPPLVDNIADFESAARGYSARKDVFRHDERAVADVLRMVNEAEPTHGNRNKSSRLASQVAEAGRIAGELIEKYAADRKAPALPEMAPSLKKSLTASSQTGKGQSKWLQQFNAITRLYESGTWAPDFVETWRLVRHNSDYYPLSNNVRLHPMHKELLLYVAPPPHLFLNLQTEKKRHTFFFIWMCIRRAWLSRMRREPDGAVAWGLTTQKWRDILSGVYWRACWSNNGAQGECDLRRFWSYGGPLVFGEDEVFSTEEDISPEMDGTQSRTRRLEFAHFSDDSVKALILWDLALCHSQLQLDRADEILYNQQVIDKELQSIRRIRRADLFHSPEWHWAIPRGVPPWEKPLSQRRHWLSRLLEVVKDWPCASQMRWFLEGNKFSGAANEQTFCARLSHALLEQLEQCMIAVYYQGVFDALGILAIGMTKRPEPTPAMEPFFSM